MILVKRCMMAFCLLSTVSNLVSMEQTYWTEKQDKKQEINTQEQQQQQKGNLKNDKYIKELVRDIKYFDKDTLKEHINAIINKQIKNPQEGNNSEDNEEERKEADNERKEADNKQQKYQERYFSLVDEIEHLLRDKIEHSPGDKTIPEINIVNFELYPDSNSSKNSEANTLQSISYRQTGRTSITILLPKSLILGAKTDLENDLKEVIQKANFLKNGNLGLGEEFKLKFKQHVAGGGFIGYGVFHFSNPERIVVAVGQNVEVLSSTGKGNNISKKYKVHQESQSKYGGQIHMEQIVFKQVSTYVKFLREKGFFPPDTKLSHAYFVGINKGILKDNKGLCGGCQGSWDEFVKQTLDQDVLNVPALAVLPY